MMKDTDGISRHVDLLIYHCLIQANLVRTVDVTVRLFTYSYDLFSTYSNSRRVTTSTNPLAPIPSSILPSLKNHLLPSVSCSTCFNVLLLLLNLHWSLLIFFFHQKILYDYLSIMALPHSVHSSHLGQVVLLSFFSKDHFEITILYLSYFLIPYLKVDYSSSFFHHLQLLKHVSTNKLCNCLLVMSSCSVIFISKRDSTMESSIKS